MAASFTAQVNAWCRQSEARALAVFREAVQDLVEEMQRPVGEGGNMPVDTGFLRASFNLNLSGPRPMTLPNPGGPKYAYDPSAASLVLLGARLGDVVYGTYTANYAAHQNYGTQSFEGRHFVDLAAQKWPALVAAAARRVQAAVEVGGGAP